MSRVAVVAHTEKFSNKEAKRLERALDGAGCKTVSWKEISHGSDAKAAAAKAAKRSVDAVIVCGGDGTVRSAAEALVGTDVALAVVPAGTANLFASGLKLPNDVDEIVALVTGDHRRTIDTGACNGQTFNVMAGTGFDVGMLAQAEDDKEKLGMIAYLRAGMDEVRHRDLFDAKITVDGEEFYDGSASCVLVGKVGTVKGGLSTFPEATPTDGRLHVAAITAAGLREWASLMTSALFHRQEHSNHVRLGEGTSISICFDRKRRFELDGGVKGKSKELEFAIKPRSLVVCASAA